MNSNYKGMRSGFATVTTLFFMWGFITVSVDPLIAALKSIFELSYAEAMLAQFAFFMAYFVVSLPAAALIARLGNSKSIIFALGVMFAGCLIVPAATHFDTFELVLVALFVIASGITILQVVANPLAAALGPPERSHFRLTFSQTFNSLGTFLAPYLIAGILLSGGIFDLPKGTPVTPELRLESFAKIDQAFLMIAGALVLLAIFIFVLRRLLDVAKPVDEGQRPSVGPALKSPWALFGSAAIFLYVGAEVSIGSAMTNFLHEPDMLNVSLEDAGKMVSLYWGGAMVGRLIGSLLLFVVKDRAPWLLAAFATGATVLCLAVTQLHGETAAYLALSIGLFNSIMFPVIFTSTLERSSASPAATSGLLCLAIVGGAVLPYIYGLIADKAGLHTAYFLPAVAYVLIVVFAVAATRAKIYQHGTATAAAGH
ncbi:MAG: sugar MFS transporter [Peristeroidobacter soli]